MFIDNLLEGHSLALLYKAEADLYNWSFSDFNPFKKHIFNGV